MKLAGLTVLDRHVEELAFLLIDSGDLTLSFRLTEALENGAHELDLDEQDSIAVLSVLGPVRGPRRAAVPAVAEASTASPRHRLAEAMRVRGAFVGGHRPI